MNSNSSLGPITRLSGAFSDCDGAFTSVVAIFFFSSFYDSREATRKV